MRFLQSEEVIAINKRVISEHGGSCGLRDKNLLESAIANPQNLLHYKNASVFEIASSYAISIIKNHPFIDGNKRTGFETMDLFLRLNRIEVDFPIDETVEIFVKIATNEVKIEELSQWLNCLALEVQ